MRSAIVVVLKVRLMFLFEPFAFVRSHLADSVALLRRCLCDVQIDGRRRRGRGRRQCVYLQLIYACATGSKRYAQSIRFHGSAEQVVILRVCSPAADAACRCPAAAARPRGRVTVRRRAVHHRDRSTGAIAVAIALAAQIAGKLDANDRSSGWKHDARPGAADAANPRVTVAIEPIVEVVPAVNATDTPRGLSSPGVGAEQPA